MFSGNLFYLGRTHSLGQVDFQIELIFPAQVSNNYHISTTLQE